MSNNAQAPSLEDVGELSGIETLHPGGLDLSKRIGELVDMRGKTVLEVACGRGVFACYYARHFGAHVTGVDVSADMVRSAIRRAREEGVENSTEFKVANGMALPFESNSFDVVISECALGLASDPQAFLNQKARVAKLGGYVGLHLSLWLKDIPDGERVDMEKRLGGRCFSLSELRTMMSRAGLVERYSEDWSGVEQLSKIRPDRRAEAIDEVFTVREKLTILWRLLRRFGLKGVVYVNQSVKKITLLHYNGTIGYCLVIAQKPKDAARLVLGPATAES